MKRLWNGEEGKVKLHASIIGPNRRKARRCEKGTQLEKIGGRCVLLFLQAFFAAGGGKCGSQATLGAQKPNLRFFDDNLLLLSELFQAVLEILNNRCQIILPQN
jgi:hypothetical protein